MILEILKYGFDKPMVVECESFEFRTNQVSNWIKLKFTNDDGEHIIKQVCVIKSIDGSQRSMISE